MTEAVRILRAGGLVAFPTETVYGLGADATNASAVQKIFTAKGRPATNPLICHVAHIAVAKRYATSWPQAAEMLAGRFWPGPLTLVLPASGEIVPLVRAGLGTVGLRVPNHPLTLELLREFDGPLAGPSANRSNHISPTTAEHVRADLGGRVDLILDGGPCLVGIESTVLDLSTDQPMILRPGGVSREQIEDVIGPVRLFVGSVDLKLAASSPGQGVRHYAPRTRTVRCSPCLEKRGRVILRLTSNDPLICARVFYAELRRLDDMHAREIAVEMPPDKPEWLALRDRILRATVPE